MDKALTGFADWLHTDEHSPLATYTPAGADIDSVFDVKVVYQQSHHEVEVSDIHRVFLPQVGPHQITDYEKIYAAERTMIFLKPARLTAVVQWWWCAQINTWRRYYHCPPPMS